MSDFNRDIFLQDINLKNKFPLLEEINIGNIKNEIFLFKNLFGMDNFNNNLKKINIITHQNYKPQNIDLKKISVSITKKSNIEFGIKKDNSFNEDNEEEEDDMYNDNNEEDENDELFVDEYQDLFEEANPVVTKGVPSKKRKIKNNEPEREKEILLVKEKLTPYEGINKYAWEKDFKSILIKKNILYFDSNIITNVINYYLIHQSLLLINNNIDIQKIKFKPLVIEDYNKLFVYKYTKNLFIIFNNGCCLYTKNNNYEMKGDDFFLDLYEKEIYYHIRERDKKERSENEISRNKVSIMRNEEGNEKNLVEFFFDKLDLKVKADIETEIYQIIFQ